MARPLSSDKRNAILDAATDVVAMSGVGAPTAKIASEAGVAEGTIFTYFATKDTLLNELYLALQMDLRDAIMRGLSRQESLHDRIRHIWNGYVGWGLANAEKRKALGQLGVSDRITHATRRMAIEMFAEARAIVRELAADGPLQEFAGGDQMRGQPPTFAAAIMLATAGVVIDFTGSDPAKAKQFSKVGFEAFCRAVGK